VYKPSIASIGNFLIGGLYNSIIMGIPGDVAYMCHNYSQHQRYNLAIIASSHICHNDEPFAVACLITNHVLS